MQFYHKAIFFCVVWGSVGATSSAALAECQGTLNRFNSALVAKDLTKLKLLEEAIATDSDCSQGLAIEAQRRRSAVELLLAEKLRSSNGSQDEFERLVKDADKSDVYWRAAVALGDIEFNKRQFAAAAVAFQRAIETIKNKSKTPTAPDRDTIRHIFRRGVEAQMLAANEENSSYAPVYVNAPKGRDGEVGGTMSLNIRGFEPKTVPLPIRFETGSTRFTNLGEQAAAELLAALRDQKPKEITLVGHTDERGGVKYNLMLSDNRARAVADFLKRNGISSKIKIIGKGKLEPLTVSDMAGLTREDIWSLNRRVEWRRE